MLCNILDLYYHLLIVVNHGGSLAHLAIYCRTANFHVLVILTNLMNEKNSLK